MYVVYLLDTFFHQIKSFIRLRSAFVFGFQTYYLIDFSKIFQLKCLEPKNKGHKNFYECCDLTKKYIKRKWMVRITFVLQRKNFD